MSDNENLLLSKYRCRFNPDWKGRQGHHVCDECKRSYWYGGVFHHEPTCSHYDRTVAYSSGCPGYEHTTYEFGPEEIEWMAESNDPQRHRSNGRIKWWMLEECAPELIAQAISESKISGEAGDGE